MGREQYLSVQGPNGTATVYEVTDDSASASRAWEPAYEVEFSGSVTRYTSEGEAIMVAQQVTGAPDNY